MVKRTPVACSLVLALGLLAGCAREQALEIDSAPHKLYVTGFSPAERAQILRAVNEWNAEGARIEIVDRGQQDMSLFGVTPIGDPAGELGLALPKLAFVFKVQGFDLCGCAKHELGHLLGLKHSMTGVMYYRYGWWTRCDE